MATLYNIYCDESCHLENGRDRDYAMAIGGIWCADEKKKELFSQIREINTRGTKTNILIFHEAENYLVIPRKGNGYVIPWTAYLIEYESRKRKLLKEYEAYIKSKER